MPFDAEAFYIYGVQDGLELASDVGDVRGKMGGIVLAQIQNSKHIPAEMINKDLAEIVAFLDVYALRCQEHPTVKELRMNVREVLQLEAPALNLSMNQWIDKFIREQGGNADWELSTRHAMHTFHRHPARYGHAVDRPQRLPVHETLHRHCRGRQSPGHGAV